MAQITFMGRVATTCASGGEITTSNVQLLPAYAPPIQYVGTTTPWLANLVIPTTTFGVHGNVLRQAKVRAYGRQSNLHSGGECVALNYHAKANRLPIITVSYRALGELVRP